MTNKKVFQGLGSKEPNKSETIAPKRTRSGVSYKYPPSPAPWYNFLTLAPNFIVSILEVTAKPFLLKKLYIFSYSREIFSGVNIFLKSGPNALIKSRSSM